MTRRVFNAGNEFHGLQEALEAVMNEDDGSELDLVVIPPEPSVLTDEEEGNEDNIESNTVPRDIPRESRIFALLRDLRAAGYRATGTVREGRTKKCPPSIRKGYEEEKPRRV
ncbi:hypothetical protein ACJJTC_003400 [Scirpophaga incertulas]